MFKYNLKNYSKVPKGFIRTEIHAGSFIVKVYQILLMRMLQYYCEDVSLTCIANSDISNSPTYNDV